MKARHFLFLSMASIFMLGACSSDDAMDNEQPWGEYNGDWDEEAAEYEKAFDRPADTYTYPIEIGSDEYIELNKQGMQAVFQAFEIPTATLKGMSTAGIIQSFIEYPFLMDFDVAHPSIQYSVERLKSMNLGQELITRKDAGVSIERRKAYKYQSLASGFRGRTMEPFMVTVSPKDTDDVPLNTHTGQEFIMVQEGTLELTVGVKVMTLEAGDSIYVNSEIPHGMRALGGKEVKFLTVVC